MKHDLDVSLPMNMKKDKEETRTWLIGAKKVDNYVQKQTWPPQIQILWTVRLTLPLT